MCCFVLTAHTRKLGKTSCTIHKKIKVNTSTNLMKPMKIYCTQIWRPLLTHVTIIMSWIWKGRHFRNTSDKAMCPVKLGFISSCCKQVKCIYAPFWQIHSGISLMAHYMEDKQMKRMRVYNDSFLRRKLLFCFVQTLQPEGWISLLFTGWYNWTVPKMPIPKL